MYDDLEFLITTKCGSRAFNLQDDDSDYDYFSIINTPDESYGDILDAREKAEIKAQE